MATGKITKESVDGISVPEKRSGKRNYLWDDTLKGFGVMVTENGVRSYLIQYRIGGRGSLTRRYTIGKHGSPWTPAKARQRADELLYKVRQKIDPIDLEKAELAEKQRQREAQVKRAAVDERLGFSTFADRYIKSQLQEDQPRSWKDTKSVITRDLKPYFLEKALTEITDDDIVDLLDTIKERNLSASIKAYKALRSIFNYATDKERKHLPPTRSPMITVKPPAKIDKRARTPTDDELRYIWQAAGGLGWPFGPMIRLLMVTGQRLREVAEAPWTEFDLDAGTWIIPAARTKNKVEMLVPLNEQALDILRELPVIKSKARLIFTTTGETPISGFSKTKAKLDASVLDLMKCDAIEAEEDPEQVELAAWRLHDFRRSFGNACQRMGIAPEIIDLCQNHLTGMNSGLRGTYQTYRFEPEKRAAMASWGRHLAKVTAPRKAGDNVVELAERRA
jgi:integrase